MEVNKHPASFRDPAGFVFTHNDKIYRQVNSCFKNDFDFFLQSGLYHSLVQKKLLLPHQQVNENFTSSVDWYTTLLPDQLNYISYPFEWSFDMLKDAALTTLEAAQEALHYGMVLKDATAYNIQFHKGKMILIDSLSFEKYDGTSPWVAYRQYCEHFLAPLLLMHYLQVPVQSLFFANTEGIPLRLAKQMLPGRSKWNMNVLLHMHLQARMSKTNKNPGYKASFSSAKLQRLLKSLKETVNNCKHTVLPTIWSDYYEEASKREDYLQNKKQILEEWIKKMAAQTAVDIGANDGTFSEILSRNNINTISLDGDTSTINNLYLKIKQKEIQNIHPLVLDAANPTPSFGWSNIERMSFLQRTNVDLVLALAVTHHFAISKNVPFLLIGKLYNTLGKKLIIEFVPKEDNKIKLMLNNRKDVFYDYTEEIFLESFSHYYKIIERKDIGSSGRVLYLMDTIM